MAILLGLMTAVCFGAADFCGGLSTKKTSVIYVVGFSYLIGLVGVAAIAPFMADAFTWRDFGIGAASGVMGGFGVVLLYRGLARGPMAVVAPVTAITSAALPAVWGVADGDSLSGLALVGIAIALVAIALASIPTESDGAPVTARVIAESLLAGIGFGAMFVLLDLTSDATTPWPVVGARTLTTAVLLPVIFSVKRTGLPTVRPAVWTIVGAGLFDTTSNVLFMLAAEAGDLSVAAVLSSLYPISTVVLARFLLNERMSQLQFGALALALMATVFIAAG